MSAALCDYSFTIALVMFTVGKVSASPTLTILNNKSHLECGTMQTVLTCELQAPLDFTMQWFVDGTSVSRCDKQSCSRKDGMSSNYNTTVTDVGNIFKFYISPVDIFDTRTFSCTDAKPSNDIIITTEEVKINKTLTTITNKTGVNNVEFVVTTSCVFQPDAVKLSLESKKVNGSGGFTSVQVESSNTETVCSNTENPYCGGNKTSKPKLVFTISTDENGGEMHQFKLRLIQTLENGTKYTITFENDEIGPLRLPNGIQDATTHDINLSTTSTQGAPTTPTPSPSKSCWFWCWCWCWWPKHFIVCVIGSIVGLIIVILVCILIYSCCKRKVKDRTILAIVCAAAAAAVVAAACRIRELCCCEEEDDPQDESGDDSDANNRHELDTREDHTNTNRSHEPNIQGQRPLGSHSKTSNKSSHITTLRNNKLEPLRNLQVQTSLNKQM